MKLTTSAATPNHSLSRTERKAEFGTLRAGCSASQLLESSMEYVYMPLQLSPSSLNQPILPNWSFNLLNVNLGASSNAGLEQAALQKVGSYGKQMGHIAEALEILIGKLHLLESKDLSREDKDTLTVFLGDVAAVRKLKAEDV